MRLLILLPLLLLASCLDAPEAARPKPLTFTQYPPFAMNVASVQVVEEYKSPNRAPNVEHEFRTTPTEAMRQWVKDRIKPVGGSRMLQVIIKDARVTDEALAKTSSFTPGYAERYTARLEVEMRIYGDGAMSEASVSAVATRSDTAGEGISAAKRDELWDQMTRDLMALMNAELERNFQQYFNNYIVYSPEM